LIRWLVGQLGNGKCRTIASALAFLRSAPPENDPLEFVFGDLLDTFTESELKVLASLTNFRDAIDLSTIAEFGDLSKAATQTALEDLADRALVFSDSESKSFALTRLVADFLRRARPTPIRESGERLTKRALVLVTENGFDAYERFPTIEANWFIIAASLPSFLQGPNDQLQTVCNGLSTFLEFTGRWDEKLILSLEAAEKAVEANDLNEAARRAFDAGAIHLLRKEADQIIALADRARSHWNRAHADVALSQVPIYLRGIGHRLKNEHVKAMALLRDVVETWDAFLPESRLVASALNAYGDTLVAKGNLDDADRILTEALRIARLHRSPDHLAVSLANLASLALARREWVAAEALAKESLIPTESIGRKDLIAENHHYLAIAILRQGRKAEALVHARRAVDIYTALRSPDLDAAQRTLRECED
jgi:tetratricopeptide (TPR) repeat protein